MSRPAAVFWLGVWLLAAGCATPPSELPRPDESGKVIYVIGQSWHTGIAIRRQDIPAALWPEHNDFPTAQFLELGWGDKEFYQADEGSVGLALKAALHSTASVLHVIGLAVSPEEFFTDNEIIAVRLSLQGFEHLCRFIHHAYKKDANGQAIPLGPGWYANSRFYLAADKYHLFHTCNTWAARALRVAGCPLNPTLALTTESVMSQVRKFGTVLQKSRPPPESKARLCPCFSGHTAVTVPGRTLRASDLAADDPHRPAGHLVLEAAAAR
jgi:uncharacterized protein (TIGR02117 family)